METAGADVEQVNVREGRPGQWLGVFGDELTLLVPGGERDRALQWWALVDDRATIEVLLDALLADGLSALSDFVLVDVRDDGRVRVVVRGSATLTAWTAEGQVRVQASGRLWAEDDFVEIIALRVDLPGHDWLPPVSSFEVRPGLCRVGGVVWGVVPELASDLEPPVARPRAVLGRHSSGDDSPEDAEDAVRVSVVSSVTQPVVPPTPPTPAGPEAAATGAIPVRVVSASVAPELAPEPGPSGPGALDSEPVPSGPHTPVSTSIPAWQEEVTTHIPPVELSGLTLLGLAADPADPADETQTRPERAAEADLTATVVRLRFNHGPTAVVDRPLVIGRAPAPRSSSPEAELITVPSPQQEISSNHVEIRPGGGVDSGTALVTDLGSTNGTVVTQPGLGPEELRPGAPMVLLPGAVIDLGDGLRIHVDQD